MQPMPNASCPAREVEKGTSHGRKPRAEQPWRAEDAEVSREAPRGTDYWNYTGHHGLRTFACGLSMFIIEALSILRSGFMAYGVEGIRGVSMISRRSASNPWVGRNFMAKNTRLTRLSKRQSLNLQPCDPKALNPNFQDQRVQEVSDQSL